MACRPSRGNDVYKDAEVANFAGETREVSRRTIAKGVAWTVPAVIVATAAPAAAASGPVLPQGVTLTPGNKGSIAIDFGMGSPNPTVTVASVSGGGATWTFEPAGKATTSTQTSGSKLVFTLAQNSSSNLTGTVTVIFKLSTGSTWSAAFAYSNSKETKTVTPATV